MNPNVRSILAFALVAASLAHAEGLKPDTRVAFDRYVQTTEARISRQIQNKDVFLYLNTLPDAERAEAFKTVQNGAVYMAEIATRDAAGNPITVPHGMVHHWLGVAFVPGVSVENVVEVIQDYDHKQDVYPEVVRSKLLSRDGEHFKAYMRFREHHVITVTLDTEHDVTYTRLDATHWYSQSYATKVSQVEDAGKPSEHDLPDGDANALVWRIDTFWQFMEKDGGVYVEVESVSLGREIPPGLNWLIKPFITSVPRDSLQDTLACTRTAVLARKASHPMNSGVTKAGIRE